MTGETISHYRVLDKVGEGGMGVVYKAEDLVLRRTVALKFLGGQVLGYAEGRTRFLHEAQAAAMVDHPNVCAVYGFEEAGAHVFIVMAFVEGSSLGERLRAGVLPLREALRIAIEIGEGLRAAHTKRIVHRDVKPGNILISPEGLVRITDFGLALLAERTRITMPGTLMGTAAYMSPEQALTKPVDRRSDIWSLGVVLYEMISGRQPFGGRDVQSMLTNVTGKPAPELRGREGPVPAFLKTVVGKAMAKQPEERYQHVDDLIVDLRAILRDLPADDTDARVSVARPSPALDPALVLTQTMLPAAVRPSRLRAALQYITGRLRGRT